MADQSSTAVMPTQSGPPDKTWEDGSAPVRRHPLVQRRTFVTTEGKSRPQWGFRDPHGTWRGFGDREEAFAAATSEYAT